MKVEYFLHLWHHSLSNLLAFDPRKRCYPPSPSLPKVYLLSIVGVGSTATPASKAATALLA